MECGGGGDGSGGCVEQDIPELPYREAGICRICRWDRERLGVVRHHGYGTAVRLVGVGAGDAGSEVL